MRSNSSMKDCVWNENGPPWKCCQCGWIYARWGEPIPSGKPPRRNCPSAPGLKPSVGDILHNLLLARLGVGLTSGCDCAKQIALMNAWGPQGCRENLNRIVGAMLSEAQRRNWKLDRRPLLSAVARIGALVPWGRAYARMWARALVLEAVRRCEE